MKQSVKRTIKSEKQIDGKMKLGTYTNKRRVVGGIVVEERQRERVSLICYRR